MTPASAFDLDLLLREDAWLRAFLRKLVDRDDVDDVVQQTWLAALQRPMALREPRAWLSALAANLARMLHRGGARILRRERRAARAASLPSTADTVARLEVQRCVAAAVCALPEPTRSALVLHYHDGLDAPAIAEQIGGTPASVRKRLQRGRNRVRTELQRQFGSDWRGSPVVLAFASAGDYAPMPPIREVLAAPTVLPFAAVATALTAGVAAVACLFLPESMMAAPAAPTASLAVALPVAVPTQPADAASRTLIGSWQEPAPAGTRPKEPPIVLRGRCLAAEDQSPLAGVEASVRAMLPVDHPDRQQRMKERIRTLTDREGRFEYSIARPAEKVDVALKADMRMERCGSFAAGAQPIDLGDILIPRAFAVRVRTVDAAGTPATGVAIEAPVPISLDGHRITVNVKSGEGGRLEPLQLPAGEHKVSIDEDCAYRLLDDVIVVREDPVGTDAVLHVERLPSICGVAFDPLGKPVPNVAVQAFPAGAREHSPWCGHAMTRTDGSFELYYRGDRPDDEVCVRFGRWGPFEEGTAPGTHKWNTGHLLLEVVPAQQLKLTVVERESGQPLEGFKVDLKWFRGGVRSWMADDYRRHPAGEFVVDRILRCRNVIVIVPRDPMLAPSREVCLDGDGSTPAPVRIEVERLRSFMVSVVDRQGAPVAGSIVDVMDTRGGATDLVNFYDYRTACGLTGPQLVAMRQSTGTTDADGRVTLLAPPSCVDLRLVVRRAGARTEDHVQFLTALPGNDEVLRVELPSR